MQLRFLTLFLLVSSICFAAWGQTKPEDVPPQPPNGGDFSNNTEAEKLPTNVILVKGAVASASDSSTPLPEDGGILESVYSNKYFRFSYPMTTDWFEKFKGPPPSDSGFYVLTQLRPSPMFKGATKGTILVTAQDLFFTLAPARNAVEMVNYSKSKLQPEFKVEHPPTEIKIAGHSFVRFDYTAPAAELHWSVLATEIRCHMVQFVFTSRDTKLLESLIQNMDKLKLPTEADAASGTGGGDVPECIKDYATGSNILSKVDPVFTDRKFNPIPVRIIISKEGKIKHMHVISAFPDQTQTITDALSQWTFKPYMRNGEPAEVETGIMFGRTPQIPARGKSAAAVN